MEMTCKKFVDISRFKTSYMDGFRKGDFIVVQEKIDGANAAIRTDGTNVYAQSRKNILSADNTLRGFYEFVQALDKERVIEVLGDDIILFGEWLVPHSVKYPEDKYQKFYAYDAYCISTQRYLPQGNVKELAEKLGLPCVHTFYAGAFNGWEEITPLVGKTAMGGEYGEGVVVKNQTRLLEGVKMDNKLPPYVKIVCEKFTETKGHRDVKPVDPAAVAEAERQKSLVATIVTPARIEKLINKMVDEDIIPYEWDEKNMGTIAKHLGKAVYEDCVKEENDIVEAVGKTFGKIASSMAMGYVKKMLEER